MRLPSSRRLFVATAFLAALTSFVSAQTNYNAYNDFYLSPTAPGWGGATTPSAAGATWGYYMGNVNANGFPSTVGTYLTAGQLYKFSTVGPLSSDSTVYSQSLWDETGGTGFPRYLDTVEWQGPGVPTAHASLGSYTTPWFDGAPGWGTSLSNFVWLQSAWLNSAESEGIASVLTWTAPKSGTFTFAGQFVSGNQPDNGASVAIVDSLGATKLGRTVLNPNATQPIAFTATYALGDVVQFQVGSDYKTANAVGLNLDVIAPLSTNVILTLQTTTNLTKQWTNLPVTPAMITPAGELNVGSLTNTNTFYRLQIRTAVQ